MKKFLLIPVLFLTVPVFAQKEESKTMPNYMSHDSSMYITSTRFIGFSYQEFDGLNERLKSNPQYEEVRNGMGIIGLGSTHKIGHFISQGGLTLGYGRNGKGNDKKTALGLIGLSMDFGYNFFKSTDRAEIFPTVGIGFEGYKAWLKKDVNNVNFDNFLSDPLVQNNIETLGLTNYFVTYRFGLNFGYSSPSKLLTIGLQAGYAGSFNQKTWKANDDQELSGAPRDRIRRFWGNLYLSKRINWRKKMGNMGMGMHM